MGAARDGTGERDPDRKPELVGGARPVAAEVLEEVMAVGLVDPVALDEVDGVLVGHGVGQVLHGGPQARSIDASTMKWGL